MFTAPDASAPVHLVEQHQQTGDTATTSTAAEVTEPELEQGEVDESTQRIFVSAHRSVFQRDIADMRAGRSLIENVVNGFMGIINSERVYCFETILRLLFT